MPDEEATAAAKRQVATVRRRAVKKAGGNPKELAMPKFSPAVVGLLRGLVMAAAVGLMGGLATVMQSGSMGKGGLVWMVTTIGTAVFRAIEGYLDKLAGAAPSPTLLGFRRK